MTQHLPDRPLSKSQLEAARSCERKWGWAYLEGLKDANRFATFGTEVHNEIEAWFIQGKLPDDSLAGKVAKSGLHHWPAPGSEGLTIEAHLQTAISNTRLHGYRDVGFEPERLIGDHKTTTNFKWALDQETIHQDIQFNIYMLASMQEWGVDRATGLWVYYRTRGANKSLAVKADTSVDRVTSFLEETVAPLAGEIHRYWEEKPPVLELRPNPRACNDYGGCPHVARCNLSTSQKLVALMAHKSLADKMRERAAAKAKSDPEPEPETKKAEAKKATPPAPKAAVNPPESKKVSSARPSKTEEEPTKGLPERTAFEAPADDIEFLFENCMPMGSSESITMASDLINTAHEEVCAAAEVADYRLVEFGRGPGLLSAALRHNLAKRRISGVFLDTRTPEGAVCAEVFRAAASRIVRAV